MESSGVSSIPPVPILVIASAVYMISAATVCTDYDDCSGKNGFAVAVGVISLAVSGALLAAKIVGRTDLIQNMHTPISIFLFFWWVAGAGVGTFSGPFSATAYLNGYFSAWTAFLCAARYAYNVSDRFREYADRGANAMKSADPSLNNIHGGEGATV